MEFKVLDTFAGAGGFSHGFETAGCQIVGAIEIDKWACETFSHNHPGILTIQKSITDITNEELLDTFSSNMPDILLGGPPCQGFSICNKNSGDPKDPRNSLFREFIRVGKTLNPKLIIMENVPNLIKAKTQDKKFVIEIIKEELKQLGYHVYIDLLEATNYGVPQIRKRIFVIASKTKIKNPFPKPTHCVLKNVAKKSPSLIENTLKTCPSLWDAISDLPEINAREGAEEMEYTTASQTEFQELLKNGNVTVYNHVAMKHSKRMVERFSTMACGDSTENVPDHLKPHRRNGNGEISKKVYGQNNRRMHPHLPCHTIPASFYANFVHPFKNRNFTAREGARIQSFPDNYRFKGKPTVVSQKLLAREGRTNDKHLCQYNQIGNAVPPLLSQAIATNLLNQLS